MLLGLSQQKLGEAIGITFQQIQKYERGANRVSASKLAAFSRVLDVSVSFFFDSMENSSSANTTFSRFDDDFDRQEMELVRIYRAMPERLRPHWFQLGRAMGSAALDVAAAE
jgi:transcriptional regulator with XRE-family HTH domain